MGISKNIEKKSGQISWEKRKEKYPKTSKKFIISQLILWEVEVDPWEVELPIGQLPLNQLPTKSTAIL